MAERAWYSLGTTYTDIQPSDVILMHRAGVDGNGAASLFLPSDAALEALITPLIPTISRQIDATTGGGSYGAITGAMDGSNQVFTVSRAVYTTGSLKVLYNGVALHQNGGGNGFVETTPGSGIFTIDFAPSFTDFLMAEYEYS